MDRFFTRIATGVSAAVGQPWAFVVAVVSILLWGISGPLFGFSDTWQLIVNTSTTIITFLMVFVIQNSQNRDGAAIQAKLDELIRAVDSARNRFIGIEHMTEQELEEIRLALEQEVIEEVEEMIPTHNAGHRSVERLIERF
jgi:low affinity Fe/Cu permease